jgi:hypothetical protein
MKSLDGLTKDFEGKAPIIGTDREFSANFDLQVSATNSVLFLGLSPPKANKTVSFFVSFHRGATQSGILFLVSIARATARRIHHCRTRLSDVSHLRGAPSRFLARPGCGARRYAGPKRVDTTREFCPRSGFFLVRWGLELRIVG